MTKHEWSGAAGLALGLLGLGLTAEGAAADCMRRIHNHSTAVLVARRDGGPPVAVPPGRSVPIRLSHPGEIELTATCGAPGAGAASVAQARFAYEAVLDRCFIRFGSPVFVPQLGRGLLGGQETAPFTVNNPHPGDVVLGPQVACPVLSRGG